jgi:EAL domain-containing protein (putative c-di-GMP-specific phosphodiesterase class I)
VEEALAWSGMQPSHLVLEVSETALARRTVDTVDVLEAIRALGARVAIDDFGTGSLALRHLARFPLDAVKIAGRLAAAPDRDPMSAALAEAIVGVGRTLGIATVAERIETEEHAERMRDLGCTYGQGYFFARPLSVAEIDEGVEGLATDHRWRAEREEPASTTGRPAPRLLEPIRQPTAA